MKTRLHKKQQNCNKLLTLFTMGIAMLTGVVAMGLSTIRELYHQARAVSYDDEVYSITFSADELNNYHFDNLNSFFITNYNVLNNSTFGYAYYSIDENDYVFRGYDLTDNDEVFCFYYEFDSYQIAFNRNVVTSENINNFTYNYDESDLLSFDSYLTISFDSSLYAGIKQAIEQDIALNNPIILSAEQLNTYHFDNLVDYFSSQYIDNVTYESIIYSLTYDSNNYAYDNDEYTEDDYYYFVSVYGDLQISLNSFPSLYPKQFMLLDINEGVFLDFESAVYIFVNSTYYNDFQNAINQDILANEPSVPPQPMLDFISIIVSGIGAFATGVANGVSDFASALFLKIENGAVVGLSVFGGILAIFAGLALAVAITTKVYLWITSLGN